jgi:hypothetical protein
MSNNTTAQATAIPMYIPVFEVDLVLVLVAPVLLVGPAIQTTVNLLSVIFESKKLFWATYKQIPLLPIYCMTQYHMQTTYFK